LPHPPYVDYVPRYDEQGKDYVDVVIDKLNAGRAWFISSDGAPGVGKTTIAYEIALRCIARELFDTVIWTSAKQHMLRAPGIIPIAEHVTSMETILDVIGTTLGNRKVLSVSQLAAKEEIVRRCLMNERCLIVVDNLETLTTAAKLKICTFLENLPRPSKALITGRERNFVGMYTITLAGMQQTEALRFMHEEALRRTLPPLADEDAVQVYKVTAGNPLAMQQVLGLIQTLGYTFEEALAFGEIRDYDTMLDFMYAEAYDKLKLDEKRILQVLPIFADPASQAAIEAASNVHSVQLALGLRRLYQSFLVQRIGEVHYVLLPFPCQFLRTRQQRDELLAPDLPLLDFLTAAHQRLASYYIEYLSAMTLDEQLSFLNNERKNVLALMEWCYTNQQWPLLSKLVDCMSRPLGTLRYLDQLILWGKRGMEACDHLQNHAQREWFKLYCVAWSHIHLDEQKRAAARQIIEESIVVAQTYGYGRLEALALRNLGRVTMRSGDYEKALMLLEESLARWRALGDLGQDWVAHTLNAIGEAKYHLGRLDEARDAFTQALQLRKQEGDTDGIIATTSDMALVLLAQGQDHRALRWSNLGIRRAEQIKKPARAYGYAQQRRAELEQLRGNVTEARIYAQEAIQTYEALGMDFGVKTVKTWLDSLDGACKN